MPTALKVAETESRNRTGGMCSACRNLTWFEHRVRAATLKRLSQLQGGTIRYYDPAGCETLGSSVHESELATDWTISNPDFYCHLATGGSLGAAESYLRGDWESDDLTTLLRILCRNLEGVSGTNSGMASIGRWLARVAHWANRNTRQGSRENIARHYDLSNRFFELFLDPTWMYS